MTSRNRLRSRRLDLADLTVLRYVPGDSWLHRRSATAKVISLVVLVVTLAISARWTALAAFGVLVVVGIGLARLPVGVAPRPPRVLWIGIALMVGLSALAGGEPVVGGIELGGLIVSLRFLVFSVTVLALAGLVGWTTPAADLTTAVRVVLAPLRPLRVPVDELVAALALAVRALPLLLAELRTLASVWQSRPDTGRDSIAAVGATVIANAVRRGEELGDAVHARGGPTAPSAPVGWSAGDTALLTIVVAVATVVLGVD